MKKLVKSLNPHNGNICFAGITGSESSPTYHLFECGTTLSTPFHATFGYEITDIAAYKTYFYFACGSSAIFLFNMGFVRYAVITGLSAVHKIEIDFENNFYLLNKSQNSLAKTSSGVIQWILSLPEVDLKDYGEIKLQSNGTIIYYNNQNMYVIRDDFTQGTVISSQDFSLCSRDLQGIKSGTFNSYHVYGRLRQITDAELDFSSSSSSL